MKKNKNIAARRVSPGSNIFPIKERRPRSQPDKPANEANTETNKGDNHEHLDERIRSNGLSVRPNPANGRGHNGSYIAEDSRKGSRSWSCSKTFPFHKNIYR